MEGILGEPISYLAYPGGFNDMLVQYVTKQSGYKMAFTVQPGTVKPGDNLYALNRLAVYTVFIFLVAPTLCTAY